MSFDQLGLWAGFILTLMVFSYVLRDNFLYRVAVYVFVGLAAGYIAILTVESVLLPWIRATLLSRELPKLGLGLIPVLLSLLLLLKSTSRLGKTGNYAIAFLVGVGTAVALVGAITGTLLPLVNATATTVRGGMVEGVVMFVGVACSLIYFQYIARRRSGSRIERGPVALALGSVGQGFIVVTLGAVYGAAIITSLTIFTERIAFIVARINGG